MQQQQQLKWRKFSDDNTTNSAFSVLSYNVLADYLALPEWLTECDPELLQWQNRGPRILNNIITSHASIICLQEAQLNSFTDYFLPQLKPLGYDGLIKSKIKEHEPERNITGEIDGCATFWDTEIFECIATHEVDYTEESRRIGGHSLTTRMTHNVALLLLLRDKRHSEEERYLLVANTHIVWDYAVPDVKMWQVHIMMQHIAQMLDKKFPLDSTDNTTHRKQTRVELIICGDFNSDSSSLLYQYLSTRRVTWMNDPQSAISPVFSEQYGLPREAVSHRFQLASAYREDTYVPPFTSSNGSFARIIDFIWYSVSAAENDCHYGHIQRGLTLRAVLEVPELPKSAPPNAELASDHTHIMAKFAW